jgi:phosphoglycolate phosphatase
MGIDRRYRLYVFDLDGTVADTREDLGRAFTSAMEEAGYPAPNMEQVTAAVGGGAMKALERLTGLKGEATEPMIARFLEIYSGICTEHTAPYPGVCELLARLAAQGAVLALVTMKAKVPTHKILSALGLDVFDEVIAFEDVERRKPDPDSLLKLMDKYGVSPKDTLMVGDAATDMQYAAAAGADACAMLRGYGSPEALLAEKPKYALNSFLEF